MTRALALPALLAVIGCGNLDRDVIVANPDRDGDIVRDAGESPRGEDDAATPAPRHTAPSACPWDGGCAPVHCDPYECSRYCPYGCGDPFPTSSAAQPHMTYHSRPRTGVP